LGHLADLSSPWAYVVIGVLAALEASAFVGLVVPGEMAVLTGGYLASIGRVSLPAMIVVAVVSAIVGDSVGYEVGRHFGTRLQATRAGQHIGAERWERAAAYLRERGGRAVFFGRFVGVLRALVPALAGASHMPYRRFLFWNALGGLVWGGSMVLIGAAAGSSYRQIAHNAGRAGLLLLALAATVVVVVIAARWIARNPERLRAALDRQLARPRVDRLRQRYNRPLTFLANRLRPGQALGLALTAQLAVLAAAGWAFGALLQDVIAGDESTRFDAPITQWFVAHREPWLTTTMLVVTHLGSSNVLLPLILVVGVALRRRGRSWAPLGLLVAAYAGSVALYDVIKPLVARPRPAIGALVATATGYAFPSGHATQAAAVYGALIIVCLRPASAARFAQAAAAAVVAVLLVGVSRVYLGVHWATDVLAGWALGTLWLLTLLASVRTAGTLIGSRKPG
jgi:undecaprenyl-diphosphatase